MTMRLPSFLTAAITAICLSACGDHLGAYSVEDMRVVHDLPSEASITETKLPYAEYLQIRLTSRFDLNAAETGPGLYADGDFCPPRTWNELIVFGPIADDGQAVESWKRKGALHPSQDDGMFRYLVYLVPASDPRKLPSNSTDTIAGYDLRDVREDVCLRFHVPGYNITLSQSDTVRIPAADIKTAFEAD